MLLEEARKLSVAERIELVEQIWDSIAEQAEEIPLTDAQRKELDRRIAAWEADPTRGSSWSEVRQRLMNRR